VEETETLRAAVAAQAEALVTGDLATFASYAAPQALPAFYRGPRTPKASGYEIVDLDASGEHGNSVVRFRGRASYTLRGAWRQTERGWRAVSLEVPADSVRAPWWRRVLGRGSGGEAPQREDLS
jgi:hypothetical protein